eukprot:4265438-Pyramimonas_sp.AAC.2
MAETKSLLNSNESMAGRGGKTNKASKGTTDNGSKGTVKKSKKREHVTEAEAGGKRKKRRKKPPQ